MILSTPPDATVYVPPVREPEASIRSSPESTWIVPALFANRTDTSAFPLDSFNVPVLVSVPLPLIDLLVRSSVPLAWI